MSNFPNSIAVKDTTTAGKERNKDHNIRTFNQTEGMFYSTFKTDIEYELM